jgi:hypothetical protein
MQAIYLTIFLLEQIVCKKLIVPLIQVLTQEEITNFETENIILPPSLVGNIEHYTLPLFPQIYAIYVAYLSLRVVELLYAGALILIFYSSSLNERSVCFFTLSFCFSI